jgi:hypothetical protein
MSTTLEPIPTTERDHEAEWQALEATHVRGNAWDGHCLLFYPAGTKFDGPPVSNRPHPDSYGADLPMSYSLPGLQRTVKAERVELAKRPVMVRQRADVDELALVASGVSRVFSGPTSTVRTEREAREIDKARTAIVKRRSGVRARASELSFNFATITP